MYLIQLLEFVLLPLVVVEFRVQEVDPLLPAFDFRSFELALLEGLCYLLPLLRGVEGVYLSEQAEFLPSLWCTSGDHFYFFCFFYI